MYRAIRWLVWKPRGEHPTTAMVRAVRKVSAMSGELITGGAAYEAPNAHRRPVDSAPVPAPTAAPAPEAVPPTGLARLGRVLPLVESASRAAYRWAAAGALSAVAVGAAVADASTAVTAVGGGVLAAVLAVPAAAVAVAGWTLADLASLPGEIRSAARAAVAGGAEGTLLVRFIRAVWAGRALALTAKGGWLRALGAIRFVRLASLPFALAAVALSVLNGAVVLAGLVAVVSLIL